MTHSPNDSFTNALIHSMTHSPNDSFTNALIHSMTHSPNDSFTNEPIHSMTHSPNDSFSQWPHSPMPSFIQWPIHPMASFTNALIHSMTHSPNDSFTNALIHQWPHSPNDSFSQCIHSPMPSFIQWPIHPMTHSPMPPFIQWPIHLMTHSPMTPFTQWLIQPMPPFTMCCSANKERGSDCNMQHATCQHPSSHMWGSGYCRFVVPSSVSVWAWHQNYTSDAMLSDVIKCWLILKLPLKIKDNKKIKCHLDTSDNFRGPAFLFFKHFFWIPFSLDPSLIRIHWSRSVIWNVYRYIAIKALKCNVTRLRNESVCDGELVTVGQVSTSTSFNRPGCFNLNCT